MADGETVVANVIENESGVDEIIPFFNKYRKGRTQGKVLIKESRQFLKSKFAAKEVVIVSAYTGGNAEDDEEEEEEEKQILGLMLLFFQPNAMTLDRDLFLTDEYVSPILSEAVKDQIFDTMALKLTDVARTVGSKSILYSSSVETRRTEQLVNAGFAKEAGFRFTLTATELKLSLERAKKFMPKGQTLASGA